MSQDWYVSGDSYVLVMTVYEDEGFTKVQDLSTIRTVKYRIYTDKYRRGVIFETVSGINPEITIADPLSGVITVDVRSDKNPQPSQQLYHKMEMVDQSGRVTTILSEHIMVEQFPIIKGN